MTKKVVLISIHNRILAHVLVCTSRFRTKKGVCENDYLGNIKQSESWGSDENNVMQTKSAAIFV